MSTSKDLTVFVNGALGHIVPVKRMIEVRQKEGAKSNQM